MIGFRFITSRTFRPPVPTQVANIGWVRGLRLSTCFSVGMGAGQIRDGSSEQLDVHVKVQMDVPFCSITPARDTSQGCVWKRSQPLALDLLCAWEFLQGCICGIITKRHMYKVLFIVTIAVSIYFSTPIYLPSSPPVLQTPHTQSV